MPNFTDSAPRALSDKLGENPSVLDFNVKCDLVIANDGVATASDATFTSASATFKSSDIGKRIVIYGAGANTGRESFLREGTGVPSTTSTNTVVSGTSLDCQSASKLILAVAAATNSIKYSLFGANAADYSDEVSILGPTTVAAAAWDYQTVTSPTKRYYRVKVQDAVGGTHGTVYITLVAFGYLHGTTIASVTDAHTVELAAPAAATLSGARWYYGTDDTVAIRKGVDSVLARLDISGGDGGGSLYFPPGQSLISGTITIPKKIELRGANMAASAIFADAESWPDGDYMVSLGDATDYSPAIATRIVDLRLNGNYAPCSGVYSQQAQESSGIIRCSIVNWRYKGIRFYYYGCQHWTLEELWVFPSSIAINDASVIGIELEQTISSNPINKATVYGQGGYSAGKGTAIRILNCNVALYDIHTENALKGVHFDTGSNGTITNNTGHPLVDSSVYIATTNDVAVQNSSANGSKNNVWDAVAGAGIVDSRVSQYLCGAAPYYFRGPSNSSARILNIVPGNFSSGVPTTFFDGRGGLATDGATPANPNVVTLNPINFGGAAQGGFLSVNSRIASFPNWEKTSTNASNLAMFVRLGASLFEVMFGSAANTGGTDPGTRAFAVDATKAILNRLWFQYGEELAVGNDSGLHRLRLTHQDTNQARFIIQRSQDSGSTWGDIAKFHLDTDKTELLGDLYLKAGAAAIIVVSGDPSGSVSIGPGTLALSTDGTLWFKTDSGTTGWIQIGGGALKGDSLTLDSAHPFLRVKKSTVLKFEIDEDGKVTQCASLNIDSAAPSIVLKNGGTQKFGVDGSGNVTAAKGKFDGPTGANPFEVYINGVLVLAVTPLGVLNVVDFVVGAGGQALINGAIILNDGVATGGKLLRTNASTLALEEVAGYSGADTVVTSVTASSVSASITTTPISTAGMNANETTIANAVNTLLSEIGSGTLVKGIGNATKTITTSGGAVTGIS